METTTAKMEAKFKDLEGTDRSASPGLTHGASQLIL